MGRGSILLLGAVAIGWMWLAFRALYPDKALIITALFGIPQAVYVVDLYLKCKCGEETSDPNQTKA